MKKLNVKIQTHGCKLNFADSQSIAKSFYESGHLVSDDRKKTSPDVIVLNSCTVTHVADAKARQAVRKAKRENPDSLVVMTGCYAERDKLELEKTNEIDLVIPNTQKKNLVESVLKKLGFEDKLEAFPSSSFPLVGRSRSSIKIQEGCDQICAYCIIPSVRGRERSISPGKIISQINEVSEHGVEEVVLTGTQLGNYGFDLERINLEGLLKLVLANTVIPRIRVSSLQPKEITTSIIDLWGSEGKNRLCPHLHIPLQSGSNKILKQMRRKYSREEYMEIINKVRGNIPGVSITSDVIVGFPGETDKDFHDTLDIVQRSKLSDWHIFPYSKRPGTSAFYSKDFIDPKIIKIRSALLRSKSEEISEKAKQLLIGKYRNILWEGESKIKGLTDDYFKVERKVSSFPSSDITKEKLLRIDNKTLIV
jgi:threonylcarbamoyladenosine tRNA methylthiotransferase MtaB